LVERASFQRDILFKLIKGEDIGENNADLRGHDFGRVRNDSAFLFWCPFIVSRFFYKKKTGYPIGQFIIHFLMS